MIPTFGLPSAVCCAASPSYSFLEITSSARVYALGGVNISTVEDDLNVVDQNPALLGPEMNKQIEIGYMRYIGDSNFANIGYAGAIGNHAAWQTALRYFGYGKMTETDQWGNTIGSFSPSDISFSGGVSLDFSDRLRGGFNLKMVYSNYDSYTAFALATDLGLNYYDRDRDLSLSFVVRNLGGQLKRFNESYDKLPVDVSLGWTQSFGNFPVRFSITATDLTKWHLPYYDVEDSDEEIEKKDDFGKNLMRHLVFGADFSPTGKYYLALGYNYRLRTDMSNYSRDLISGFSAGGGIKVSRFLLGVAFSRPHTGSLTMMFNATLNIDDVLK